MHFLFRFQNKASEIRDSSEAWRVDTPSSGKDALARGRLSELSIGYEQTKTSEIGNQPCLPHIRFQAGGQHLVGGMLQDQSTKTVMQHKALDVLAGYKSVLRPHTGRRVGESGAESPRAATAGTCRDCEQREL